MWGDRIALTECQLSPLSQVVDGSDKKFVVFIETNRVGHMFSIRRDGGSFFEEGVLCQFLEFFGVQVNLENVVETIGEGGKEQFIALRIKTGGRGLVKRDVDLF